MATQTTFIPPTPNGVDYFTIQNRVIQQWALGATQIALPVTEMLALGPDSFDVLKSNLEAFTDRKLEFLLDASAGIVGVKAVEPMVASVSASQPNTKGAASTKKSVAKVTRPKNAFMIYRLDHHTEVSAQHPGMHNNDISKIIGGMWARESQAVKDEYKQKAEEEKRQHAIDHPGYQYQPRKPSEKKKRMTKNKLAKLAASSRGTDITTDAAAVEQTAVDTFTSPYQNSTPQLITHNEGRVVSFDVLTADVAGLGGDDGLHDQMTLFNSQQPQLQANAGMGIEGAGPVASGGYFMPAEDILPTNDAGAFAPAFDEWASDPTITSEEARTQDPYAEQYRQEELDEQFGLFFDIDSATGTIPDNFTPAIDWQAVLPSEA